MRAVLKSGLFNKSVQYLAQGIQNKLRWPTEKNPRLNLMMFANISALLTTILCTVGWFTKTYIYFLAIQPIFLVTQNCRNFQTNGEILNSFSIQNVKSSASQSILRLFALSLTVQALDIPHVREGGGQTYLNTHRQRDI